MSRYAFMASVALAAIAAIVFLGWLGLPGGGLILTVAILALFS